MLQKLLSKAEAAEALHVEEKTLDYWRWTGQGPDYVKLPRKICYTEAALNDFIKARTKHPMAQ
jgi:hypothetical protein